MKTFSKLEALARKNAKASEQRNNVKVDRALEAWKKEVRIETFVENCRRAVEDMRYAKEFKAEQEAYHDSTVKGN